MNIDKKLSEVRQTSDYGMFKFRADNEHRITPSHVRALVKSISSRNMLEFRPIVVSKEMEILDGQHRLKAAEELGLPIYYQIQEEFEPTDIIAYQCAKSWVIKDYYNFWLHHKKPDYLKLEAFMKQNGLSHAIGINMFVGGTKDGREDFKQGKFKFMEGDIVANVDACWETIGYIRKIQGDQYWLNSSRFWRAMLTLFRHTDFDIEQWRKNFRLKVDHFRPCVSNSSFLNMLLAIYNHNLRHKLTFDVIEDKDLN